jgi:hypothetical protein
MDIKKRKRLERDPLHQVRAARQQQANQPEPPRQGRAEHHGRGEHSSSLAAQCWRPPLHVSPRSKEQSRCSAEATAAAAAAGAAAAAAALLAPVLKRPDFKVCRLADPPLPPGPHRGAFESESARVPAGPDQSHRQVPGTWRGRAHEKSMGREGMWGHVSRTLAPAVCHRICYWDAALLLDPVSIMTPPPFPFPDRSSASTRRSASRLATTAASATACCATASPTSTTSTVWLVPNPAVCGSFPRWLHALCRAPCLPQLHGRVAFALTAACAPPHAH